VPRRRTIALAVGVVVVVAIGAGGGIVLAERGPSARERSRAATERPCRPPYVELEAATWTKRDLRLVAVDAADQPAALAVDPRGLGPTLLGEREGRVRVVDDAGRVTARIALDLTDTSDHGDGGLLGLAYDPDGGWLYAYRSTAEQDDVVTAYPLDDDGLPDQGGEILLLASGHPSSEQHHGGAFAFGPDGYLYIGFGDGGGLGDPRGNAQDGGTLLGKLLRIDPTPGGSEPYAVPADNPFVGRDGWRPEIWAYGVRNPYRIAFDAASGDLWLGDVGQSCWEEIDRLRAADAGANLGWDRREGNEEFEGGDVGGHAVWPVHTYSHRRGWCALVIGYVVRSPQLTDLDGWLLHADYCRGRIMAFRPVDGDVPQLVDTGLRVERPVAIVEGPDGLPWVLSLDGLVQRIEPAP